MSANEIERVKQDIATIKQAAGLELPFGWDSVWMTMFGVPAMGAWWLLCWFIFDKRSPYVFAVPIAPLLAVQAYFWFKYRRIGGSSANKRRENRSSIYASIVLVAAMLVFLTWAQLSGTVTAYRASGLVTILGLMGTLMAFQSKGRLSYLGGGIPLILLGISMAIWPSPSATFINACITLVVAGPATAFIMMYQLKRYGTEK